MWQFRHDVHVFSRLHVRHLEFADRAVLLRTLPGDLHWEPIVPDSQNPGSQDQQHALLVGFQLAAAILAQPPSLGGVLTAAAVMQHVLPQLIKAYRSGPAAPGGVDVANFARQWQGYVWEATAQLATPHGVTTACEGMKCSGYEAA